LSTSERRAKEYLGTAERLRDLSQRAQYPQVSAELAWLAQSYERLAIESAEGGILDGDRSREMVDKSEPSN
jgi:hypothetical protein